MKGTISILAALFLFGCSDNQHSSDSGKRSAFVSIPPQAGLLKAIAGDRLEVHTLVGEGQSPHSYEPTARQLANLGEADLFFTIGVPFENTLMDKITRLYPDLATVDTREQIILLSMPHAHHGEHCDHDHGAKDPHVWLSPKHASAVAANMVKALADHDPDNAPFYWNNYEQLLNTLDALFYETRDQLAPFKGSRFYVFHPSFGYFAEQFGLHQIPIELDGKAPSPRQLADLIEQAQVDGVKVIFVQKQFPINSANAVAEEIGGTVVQLDPLAEDVVANLKQIADSIALALET